ncbi:MAG: hypothetical protein JO329_09760 [Planctomycetaceae bacterium]|nr:hypothetical protein [Planctomycetaceae bacterium]
MTRPHLRWRSVAWLGVAAVGLGPGPARSAPAEVKLDRDFLAALVENLPPCPFQQDGEYRGTAQSYRLQAIDPRTRRFLVACQVEGEFRPLIPRPFSGGSGRGVFDWRKFRFDVQAGVNVEPGGDGPPRFHVDVEEVKLRELEGVAGVLARLLGRQFDEMATRIADGKVALMSVRLNAEVARRVEALKPYGVLCGIDYAPERVVLLFDLTRFRSEGISGYVFPTPRTGTAPLFRWFRTGRGDHFYTTDPAEPDRGNHLAEGIACHVFDRPMPQTVPLYRWAGPREHFYTTAADGEMVYRLGYRLEGVACFLYPDPKPGTIPLYRFVDPRNGLHFYSTHPHAEFAK